MKDTNQRATIYRMVMDKHTCPYGLKAKDLLEREGFEIEDRPLTSREEVDRFKAEQGVETTPQIFIADRRVGGYDDLKEHFGKSTREEGEESYRPLVAIFGMTALMALALSWASRGEVFTLIAAEWFVALSMCVLAIQKLKDVSSFSTMFLNYDLLAKRWVPYSYIYPFAEGLVGVLMLSGALVFISAPLALFIGGVGAISVIKAVYIDNRDLKCACVGGDTAVPLGAVSLTENVMMVAMGVWMPIKLWVLGWG